MHGRGLGGGGAASLCKWVWLHACTTVLHKSAGSRSLSITPVIGGLKGLCVFHDLFLNPAQRNAKCWDRDT